MDIEFYCLAHNHKTREEEIECSARFQIENLQAEVERLREEVEFRDGMLDKWDKRVTELVEALKEAE